MEAPFLRLGTGRRAGRVVRARPPGAIVLGGPAVGAGIPGHGAWVELVAAATDWQGRPSRRLVIEPSTGVEVTRDRLQLRLSAPVPVPRVRVLGTWVAFRFARLAWKDVTEESDWNWDWTPFLFGIFQRWFEVRRSVKSAALARFLLRDCRFCFHAVRMDLLFESSVSLMIVYRIPDGAVVAEFQGQFGCGAVVSPSGHKVVYRGEADQQWRVRERRDGFAVERLFGAPWDFKGLVLTAAGEFAGRGPTPTTVQVWTEDSGLAVHDCLGFTFFGSWQQARRFAFLVYRDSAGYVGIA